MLTNRIESDHLVRNNAKTTAAIERARKLDDEAFSNMPRPQPKDEPMTIPVQTPPSQTQNQRPSLWTAPKRSILAIKNYFDDHPFWGKPVDPAPTIVFRRLGAKLRNTAKHCACGTLGAVEGPSVESGDQVEKVTLLNEKAPATGEYILIY